MPLGPMRSPTCLLRPHKMLFAAFLLLSTTSLAVIINVFQLASLLTLRLVSRSLHRMFNYNIVVLYYLAIIWGSYSVGVRPVFSGDELR